MRRTFTSCLVFVVLLAGLAPLPRAAAAQADPQNPFLVKNINSPASSSSEIRGLMEYNDLAFYFAHTPEGSGGLWQSDGTPENTYLIKEGLWNGSDPSSSSNQFWHVYNGILYFRADDHQKGEELWRTDGTPDGTYLLEDINLGLASASPSGFVEMEGWLYFVANNQLWRTDGTLVEQITFATQSVVPWPILFNGKLYFAAQDGETGVELWRSDGTPDGTQQFIDILPGPDSSNPRPLLALDGWLYFTATDGPNSSGGHGTELWVTDGSPDGTRLFADLNPYSGSNPSQLTPFDNGILFTADDASHGREIWWTAGMSAQVEPSAPVLVADLLPGLGSSDVAMVGMLDGAFLFFAKDADYTSYLWSLSTAASAPQKIGKAYPKLRTPCCDITEPVMAAFQDKLFFEGFESGSGWELWETDGTPNGTHLSVDIWPGPDSGAPDELARCGTSLCFPGNDGQHGAEFWSTTGAPGGAALVYDYNTALHGSNPRQLTAADRFFYFTADDGIHGTELWRSDGTPEGTALVYDADPTNTCATPPDQITPLGEMVFFTACNSQGSVVLWEAFESGGWTERVVDEYTHRAFSPILSMTPAQNKLFFVAAQNGRYSLWVSDWYGRAARVVDDLSEDTAYWLRSTSAYDHLWFLMSWQPGVAPAGLYTSDGRDYFYEEDFSGLSYTGEMMTVGIHLVFSGLDLSGQPGIWDVDRCPCSVTQLSLPAGSPVYTSFSHLTNANGQVFFFASNDQAIDLYRLDLTQNKINLAQSYSAADWLAGPYEPPTSYGGRLAYTMQKPDLSTVAFISDGTPAGTGPIPGATGSALSLTSAGPYLFFSQSDVDYGRELWRWDGTTRPAERVSDINPGPASSDPTSLLAWKGRLYFSADDGANGAELWAYEISAQQIWLPVVSQ